MTSKSRMALSMLWFKENPKNNSFQYPQDRRFRIRIRSNELIILIIIMILPLVIAWLQYLSSGLPKIHVITEARGPSGFASWIRISHYLNLIFITLLVRSGLSILMDHPRFYWSVHCTPSKDWLRFTPLEVPVDRYWTAKDDSRYISPWFGLPGYRHTVGVARNWHFPTALCFIGNGIVFISLTFITFHWQRLVPNSWSVLSNAWSCFVHYATFNMPPEPNGFYVYNGLQKLSYFAVIFIMAPLSILTGLAMSPAIDHHFPRYVRIFGNRQIARSIHFLLMVSYLGFIFIHVTMVVLTGFARNMNHIVFGTDTTDPRGIIFGLVAILVLVLIVILAYWFSWSKPRVVQRISKAVIEPLMRLYLNPLIPVKEYSKKDISPYFWANGKMPTSQNWNELEKNNFIDYRLKVYGLVENPVELSLEDIKAMTKKNQITLHHCIQGWSGIAEWRGLPMSSLVDLVKPSPGARVVAFYSYGEGIKGGRYYETQMISNLMHPQTILAYEMNGKPLGRIHGGPLRLRVENQLGYKMIKWIESIEFISDEGQIGKGFGGKNEDDEYFDLIPNI